VLSSAPDALSVSQHSTDSLSLLVAEDFHRARFALRHCASYRHREAGQILLSKPPREFPELIPGRVERRSDPAIARSANCQPWQSYVPSCDCGRAFSAAAHPGM
jgi:hypothetical protein